MNEEDEAFEQIEKAQGWRKRQIEETKEEFIKFKDAFPYDYVMPVSRNDVLEEVALEIEKMKVFGNDTIGSFAAYIRNMKK